MIKQCSSTHIVAMEENTPLQTALDELGKPQSWLASKTGLDRAHVNRLCRGKADNKDLTNGVCQRVSRAVGKPVEVLFPVPEAA